tara:strand:+ start:76 stop:708 length:633 start_codon:yes stop_codon:yes gene_type:complete
MNDLLQMKRLVPGGTCPVMVSKIPKDIFGEIKEWVRVCRKYKDHPLADLRAHENVGYKNPGKEYGGKIKHNTYQCSVPAHLIDQSFWLGWIVRLAAKYYGGGTAYHRDFFIRDLKGHFDRYDVWVNFAYKGDDNPLHNHAGFLSGVIYVQNDRHPTIFPEYNTLYNGENGTMVLFPSNTMHFVDNKNTSKERVTLAFNLERLETSGMVKS